jgi:tetratricopeptide (TPR) repeat protein
LPRNSSFTFKGKAVDIKEVGRRLGVRYVLEGSVRKASGKVRITGQLIDAVTGAHIWADRFERDLTDVFTLQDEVAVAVVSAVQPKMLQTEIELATRRRLENLTAYDFYLRAMRQNFDGWHNRGWVYKIAGSPEEAIRSFERAMRMSPLDPLLPRALIGMGYSFIELGRFDEAIVTGKKAQRQNPFYPVTYRCLASAFAHLGREAEAREAAVHLLETDPAFTISGWIARGGQSNSKMLIEGLRKAGLPE